MNNHISDERRRFVQFFANTKSRKLGSWVFLNQEVRRIVLRSKR